MPFFASYGSSDCKTLMCHLRKCLQSLKHHVKNLATNRKNTVRELLVSCYKCIKHQFIHLLTATCNDWHIENSKNHKKVILFNSTLTVRQCDGE